MSQDPAQLAQRMADAINAREIPDGLFAPEFLMENVRTAVTDAVYHGPEGFGQWMEDLFESFDEGARFEFEVLEATDHFVVGRLSLVGRGSASGAPLELRWAAVLRASGGLITRATGYRRRREAFEAVGRSE
jgi:hypothetical protein